MSHICSDWAQDLTSKFGEQDSACVNLLDSFEPSRAHPHNQNDVQRQLPNAEHAHVVPSDSERNSAIEGKSIDSGAIKSPQHLLDCSLTRELLKKIESRYSLMNKNLAGADEYHAQFSSEAYWETVEIENRIDGSSIPTQPHFTTSMPNPSLCRDQLCEIIDFTTNWTCVGSQNEENRRNFNRTKVTKKITQYSNEIEPNLAIRGSLSCGVHPNSYQLPSQTTDATSLKSANKDLEHENAASVPGDSLEDWATEFESQPLHHLKLTP